MAADVMSPRALGRLAQMTQADAFSVLGEGLGLLGEHVQALTVSIEALSTQETGRGHHIVDLVATEEAAKALIILDIARCGWRNHAARSRLLKAFYNHTLRLLYARIHQGSPADMAEVAGYVDALRVSHYLDGPNDADWIFRNELDFAREGTLYVDRVAWGDGQPDSWVTPLEMALHPHGPSASVRLVNSLRRLGVLTTRGLELCAAAWSDVRLVHERRFDQDAPPPTRWEVCRDRNRVVIEELREDGAWSSDVTGHDLRDALDQWTFPLGHLDLTVKQVSLDELRQRQRAVLERMNSE